MSKVPAKENLKSTLKLGSFESLKARDHMIVLKTTRPITYNAFPVASFYICQQKVFEGFTKKTL